MVTKSLHAMPRCVNRNALGVTCSREPVVWIVARLYPPAARESPLGAIPPPPATLAVERIDERPGRSRRDVPLWSLDEHAAS
jgi:hypothetical protein